MLPGTFGFVAPLAPLTTISVHASAVTATQTVVIPATVIAGDLLVLLDYARNGNTGAPTDVVFTNFTRLTTNQLFDTSSTEDERAVLSYKIAVGADAGATITGMTGALQRGKALYVFRGDVPISSVTPSTVSQQVTSGNPTAQTVAASGGAPPLVILGAYNSTNAVSPRTFTVGGLAAKDGEINGVTTSYLAYKIYNASPADASIDMDDEGTNMLASCYLGLL